MSCFAQNTIAEKRAIGYIAPEVFCRNFGWLFHNGIIFLEIFGSREY